MRLKELRIINGLTQAKLAEAIGTNPQNILNWENEFHEPDIAHLILLADYFNVTVDYLIGHDTNGNSGENILNALKRIDPNDFVEFLKMELEKISKDIK